MKYHISDEAIRDLDDIWLYTLETWSAEQADRYFNLLLNEIEYIANHFEDGRNMDFIKNGYRVSKMKSHLIFYKKSTDGTMEIIRILHQMMDIEKRLK
ncbi:type II toxin-antitoxin system RelE/ParE family toxin [uncultured Flavobacterium sp.]|uniref:type II toxin-antitoxin system RelE/ParE family toxin n=1 Tax=uncultured Flavobacterium sp. TaxID=165435 RepID=UPI0025FDEA97|nr:type II toxin-antitoxin system RelE/ParE family toxin [uncultured Flavobacterium sp.]